MTLNTTVASIDAEGIVTVKAEGETTIKAIFAGDDTYKASTVEYVLTVTDERTNYQFTTIAELRALATSTTAVTAYGTLTNAVVSYVPNTGNAIIKDATGSVLYYKSGHGLKQGQTYTGDLTITVKLYNTFAEITSITGAAFTGDQAAVDPEVVTLSDLIGNFATYQSTYVKLEGLTVSSVSGKNVTVTDGTNSYAVYSSAADATCSEGDIVTIIGTVSHHGDADQIQVWSKDSIIVTQAHEGGEGEKVWTLVTDASALAAGDVIVFAAYNVTYKADGVEYTDNKVMGAISNSLGTPVNVTFSSDGSSISSLPSGATQYTLGGSSSAWTIMNGDKYLTQGNKKITEEETSHTWTISISNNEAIVASSTDSSYKLQYNPNSGNGRFATYSSNQKPIRIYRCN